MANKSKLDLSFLKSVRFWKVAVVAILVVLQQNGIITGDLQEIVARVIEILLGVSVGIRTIDRFAEKIGK